LNHLKEIRKTRKKGRGVLIQQFREKESTSRWTYSAVSWVMRGRELKPDPMKESRYWVIFNALSQSSTELTLLRSGAPRSSRA